MTTNPDIQCLIPGLDMRIFLSKICRVDDMENSAKLSLWTFLDTRIYQNLL
jgi:hypothetical protein